MIYTCVICSYLSPGGSLAQLSVPPHGGGCGGRGGRTKGLMQGGGDRRGDGTAVRRQGCGGGRGCRTKGLMQGGGNR